MILPKNWTLRRTRSAPHSWLHVVDSAAIVGDLLWTTMVPDILGRGGEEPTGAWNKITLRTPEASRGPEIFHR